MKNRIRKISNKNWNKGRSHRRIHAPKQQYKNLSQQDVTNTKGHEFEEYDLKKELMQGLAAKGYDKPSPV